MKAHLVLTTKYRRKIINKEMLKQLEVWVYELCDKWNCKVIEFNGEADHVHILFQYLPQMEIPKFVGNLKSVSSRKIREQFADQVDKTYWKAVFWNESYFIASCGGVTVSILKKYIESQNSPE